MLSAESKERKALHYFSLSFLINFIFGIVGWIVSFTTIGFVLFSPMPPNQPVHIFSPSSFIPILIVNGIGVILSIYYLWHGFDLMEKILPDISLGKTGSILLIFSIFVYPSLLSVFIIGPAFPDPLGPIMVLFFIAGTLGVVGLIGFIMVLIGIYRIGDHYNSTIIKVGAILMIFIGIVGAILLFIGFKDLENNPRGKKAIVLPPPPPW
ncbi:Protein of unknown function (DUF973) [Aciduliprofundum sp. MAR08-339]|uniref:DUF973 family protein n=1 Tax=Aciduliprofundum sp. (strain MAR08-339) TaxID=673860 RepID=UPI0002A47A18|nr:Protein of unknown function (DUF973) [Aciduliprofundum sp. MAR08-339]